MTFVRESGVMYRNEQGVTIEVERGFDYFGLTFQHDGKFIRVHPESGWVNPTKGTPQFDPAAVLPGSHFVTLHLSGSLTPAPGLVPFSDEEIARQFKEVLLLSAPTSKVTVTLNSVEV